MARRREIPAPILIADDGELTEVRRLVDEMGLDVVEPGTGRACRAALRISNVRHALARHDARDPGRPDTDCFDIVVAERISWGLRRELERTRPEFLLERPVDPGVLRLLIGHALERAPERRRLRAAYERPGSDPERPARRRAARGRYERSVLATNATGARVLIGCDLSIGGMRVAPQASLAVGDAVKLVVHGGGGCAPVVVKAVVARDEGRDGLVLRFEGLSAAAGASLERIVAALPDSRPADAGPSGPNVVVSELVEEPGEQAHETR